MGPGPLDMDRIRRALRTQRVGRCIDYSPSVESTNDEALRRIDAGDVDGLVVLAEHQHAGRGRLGRSWHSPRGASILCSVVIVDDRREFGGGELGLIAAVSTAEAITGSTDVRPTINWPNDLLVHGRKIGGILIESRSNGNDRRGYVIGIGINCLHQRGHFPIELAGRATSLELESRAGIDRSTLVVALLSALDGWLAKPSAWSYPSLRSAWLALAEPMGRHVHLQHAGRVYSGSVIDIDPRAALLVQLDEGGIRAFDAAETTIIHRETTAVR